jgi:hypothetical protein
LNPFRLTVAVPLSGHRRGHPEKFQRWRQLGSFGDLPRARSESLSSPPVNRERPLCQTAATTHRSFQTLAKAYRSSRRVERLFSARAEVRASINQGEYGFKIRFASRPTPQSRQTRMSGLYEKAVGRSETDPLPPASRRRFRPTRSEILLMTAEALRNQHYF